MHLSATPDWRALGVTERGRRIPDVPGIAETVPGYQTCTSNALFAPPEVVARLNAEARVARVDTSVAERMKEFSATLVGSSPEELASHVSAEIAKWQPVVSAAGVQLD